MKFHLADNCAIVFNGKPAGELSDLKLGDQLTFNYDDANGAHIVDRIGVAVLPQELETIINPADGTVTNIAAKNRNNRRHVPL